MNKRFFKGLIILMTVSIIGIIMVQLIWMNNAMKVNRQLFNKAVAEALHQTAEYAEKARDVNVISTMSMKRDSTLSKLYKTQQIHSSNSNSVIIRSNNDKKKSSQVKVFITSSGSGEYTFNIDDDTKNDSIKTVHEIIVDNKADLDELDSIYKLGIVKIDKVLDLVTDVDLVVPEVKQKVETKVKRLKTVANQVVTEIETLEDVNINFKKLKTIFQKVLKSKNIPLDYEMAIFKDSLVSYQTENADTTALLVSDYKIPLYTNDIIDKKMQLAVIFPDKESYIYRTISLLLISSLVLSFLVLLSFSLSIYFMLKQKKISEMKSDFINNMTHEFKTPIATISLAADSVSNEKVINNPEQIKYYLGMIKKENTRMNRQVEDILTIAKLDKEDFEFKWDLVDVHELIEEAISGISLQVEKKSGKIKTKFEAGNPIVTCDKNHCANIIFNLLDNALKYSTDSPQILIETKNCEKGILVAVEDNGIGMSKSVQSKIFERFYRQTSGNIHNVKGFGLGLSYVKAVIEANKGNITVKSEPNKGSRFEVFVPFIRE